MKRTVLFTTSAGLAVVLALTAPGMWPPMITGAAGSAANTHCGATTVWSAREPAVSAPEQRKPSSRFPW